MFIIGVPYSFFIYLGYCPKYFILEISCKKEKCKMKTGKFKMENEKRNIENKKWKMKNGNW
jgi:hypothetical protein